MKAYPHLLENKLRPHNLTVEYKNNRYVIRNKHRALMFQAIDLQEIEIWLLDLSLRKNTQIPTKLEDCYHTIEIGEQGQYIIRHEEGQLIEMVSSIEIVEETILPRLQAEQYNRVVTELSKHSYTIKENEDCGYIVYDKDGVWAWKTPSLRELEEDCLPYL